MEIKNKLNDIICHKWFKPSLLVAAIASVGGVIYLGYGGTLGEIVQCKATVKKYVTAEYSETTTGFYTDMDGNTSMETDTDYWSEPASDVFVSVTLNGELVRSSSETSINNGAHYPPMPRHDVTMQKERHFDRFQNHTKADLLVSVIDEFTKEHSSFSNPIQSTEKCNTMMGRLVAVSTWYGITYETDF